MQNDAGEVIDLYIPRKWYATRVSPYTDHVAMKTNRAYDFLALNRVLNRLLLYLPSLV